MATPNYPFGTIIPSQQTPIKPNRSNRKLTADPFDPPPPISPPPPPPATDPCDCNQCEGMPDGFFYCWDGAQIQLNDYPKAGGPWIPAINPNGTVVWINGGGL